MRTADVIQIETPKKFILNGLWFGPRKPQRVVVWVHGLGSSMFSKLRISDLLVDRETAVLVFNNRGHDTISHLVRADGKKGSWAGAAHENFADCVDDIQGAVNFAKRTSTKKVFLVGHSTGCQKSIYWAAKGGKGVAGITLLAPVSDYASERMLRGDHAIKKAEKIARRAVASGRAHELLPRSAWGTPIDAQRFLSLYTANSAEEIFSYAQPKRTPTILRKVRIPLLVLWAERDEYSDRSVTDVIEWFGRNLSARCRMGIVPNTGHSFKGAETEVARRLAKFMKEA